MSKQNDDLGDRMKRYENCYDVMLPCKMPMILRIDGRVFHTWVRKTHCAKPFDEQLMHLMAETTRYLCQEIEPCEFGYTQSDEISLLLRDDQTEERQPWFSKRLQKMCSLGAAIATYYFNAHNPFERKLPAYFDARAFIIPEAEIRNYFVWRQNDASKNSLSMLAQSLYTQKELQGKKRADLHELCFQKGCNWNDWSTPKKRGIAVYRQTVQVQGKLGIAERQRFVIDENIPIFTDKECKLFES